MISLFVRFSDSASDDEDGDGEAELLDSDEDEIDENGAQYLEKLEKSIHNSSGIQEGKTSIRNRKITTQKHEEMLAMVIKTCQTRGIKTKPELQS